MKISESEMNNLVISFIVKTEHEQSKELKSYHAKSTQLKKDLGEVEAKITTLESEGFRARHNPTELSAIEAQVLTHEASKAAIREEIEQISVITTRLDVLHQDQLVLKLLKRNKKCSVKAVESMLKATSV